MSSEVLAKAGVFPRDSRFARLDGWDITIAPRATLVPAPEKSVFGVLARLSHADLDKLYAKDWFGFGTYLPEAVLVTDAAGKPIPALTYIAWEMEKGVPTAEYIRKVTAVARQFEFPEWYIRHIESFGERS